MDTNGNNRPYILGISGSLRNARWGIGSDRLVDSLKDCSSESQMREFLKDECEIHLENFVDAGRDGEKPFTEVYKEIRKQSGDQGLSNSEVTLAAALWSAHQNGAIISHLSLVDHFLPNGTSKNLPELKQKLLQADGLIISTPVYFGDRGSLTQSLIEFIREDPEIKDSLQDTVHGGLSVGSKRNGGQETTLIYLLRDILQAGAYGVGNDSQTTSQYGGTGKAGDVGTMHKDDYGLKTSMGTGRRVANVSRMLKHEIELDDTPRVLFMILQESDNRARKEITNLIEESDHEIEATIIDVTQREILRCIACDFCPTHIDVDQEYRCIINSDRDDMEDLHEHFLYHDSIVPVAISIDDTSDLRSNYQQFVERTRYLRRGDYVMSNWVSAPLVFEEIGHSQNMAMRMMTSMIRHNTVLSEPMIGYIQDGKILNDHQLNDQFKSFIDDVKSVTAARYSELGRDNHESRKYTPTGYILSAAKDVEDRRLNRRKEMIEERHDRLKAEAERRVKFPDS